MLLTSKEMMLNTTGSQQKMLLNNSSQITLVQPAQPPGAHTLLVLSRDSTISTQMTQLPSGTPLYTFRSNAHGTKTDIFREGEEQPFAVYGLGLLGRGLTRDGEKVSVGKWLRPKHKLADFPLVFDHNGVQYQWRTNIVGQLALYAGDAPDTDPVAWYNRSRKRVIDGVPTIFPAFIALKEEVSFGPIRDDVVVSWRIAAEKARMKDGRANTNEGHGMATMS